MIKHRQFWLHQINQLWQTRSVIWLSGVRRVGKTCLSQTVPNIEYFDCELPRTRRMLEDPESFLDGLRGHRVVLDEIHRLDNPSELLKIAADHYPGIKILATGSSTLGASKKFKDTLAGRKAELWLTPMITADLTDFGAKDIRHRFLHGGLPPFFLAKNLPEREFQEWLDAFWAKDIQELFRLERRQSFQKFAELLFMQSGGIFVSTHFTRPCEVKHPTIANYLNVLAATFATHIIRPYSSHRATEITAAPKVYAFDTGFVCYHRGWHELRDEDYGYLWEHWVLNELHAQLQSRDIHYWRDKRGHEIDFVLVKQRNQPVAIECKWSGSEFDPTGLKAFRRQYPQGANFVVAHDITKSYHRKYDDFAVDFVGLPDLIKNLVKLLLK
jgi:hypothetical protein